MATKTYVIRGKAFWAKVVGDPVPGYNNGPPEWTLDVVPEEDSIKKLKELGVGSYIKDRTNGPTIAFKRKAVKKNGDPSQPIPIYDHHNAPWDGRLIGNGSTVNVCFTINETKTKPVRLKPSILQLQVWDYVPYKTKSPFETKEGFDEPADDQKEAW